MPCRTEALRSEPPGPTVARYVTHDVEYHGETVPAGNALVMILGSANRDERHYDDPDRFDIHRRFAHLSFGYGTHYCLGAALARMEGRIALEEVLDRWPAREVDLDTARRAPTSTAHGWASMPPVVGLPLQARA